MIYEIKILYGGQLSWRVIDDSIYDDVFYTVYNQRTGITRHRKNDLIRHREDGPAVYSDDGTVCEYYFENKNITHAVNKMIAMGILSSDWRNWSRNEKMIFKLRFV